MPNSSIDLASQVPKGWGGWTMRAVGETVLLLPIFGVTGRALTHVSEIYSAGPLLTWGLQAIPATTLAMGVGYLLTDAAHIRGTTHPTTSKIIRKPLKHRLVTIGGMTFTPTELCHNVLILGGIGAGKTSGALDPATDQILNTFNDPGDEIGGFFLDVKGNRTARILFFAHHAGRDVIKSAKVIRPNCMLLYLEFKCTDTGFNYFIPAVNYATGNEAERMVSTMVLPDGSPELPPDVFTKDIEYLEKFHPLLKSGDFYPKKINANFIGWRRIGDTLKRVLHTNGPHKSVEVYKTAKGEEVIHAYPERLKYSGFKLIDNGLHYNLINNEVPPSEAARRLKLIGQLLQGQNGGGGDNKFWDDGAEGHIINCIEHLMLTNDKGKQVDATDITRITTDKEVWTLHNERLKGLIAEMDAKASSAKDPEIRDEFIGRVRKMKDIKNYFETQWVPMDAKTKGILTQVIKQLFSQFLLDFKLQKSFCSPSTYSFKTAINNGDLFIFGGCEYEVLAKLLGTALKLDFQSTIISRTGSKQLNQKRYILFENDECQAFAIAGSGSGAGDDHNMSLARESRLINLLATQTLSVLAAVLGDERARVYAAACGGIISFQISDPKTAEIVSKVIPEIMREKRRLTSSEIKLTKVLNGGGQLNESIEHVREPRFHANDFMALDLPDWEAIAYNKAKRGNRDKALRQKNKPHFIGSEQGQASLTEFMRWYEVASLEEVAYKCKESERFSPGAGNAAAESAKGNATATPVKESPPPSVIAQSVAPVPVTPVEKRPEAQQTRTETLPVNPVSVTAEPEKKPAASPTNPTQQGATEGGDKPDAANFIPEVIPSPTEGERRNVAFAKSARITSNKAGINAAHPQDESPTNTPSQTQLTEIEKLSQMYQSPELLAQLAVRAMERLKISINRDEQRFVESKACETKVENRVIIQGPAGSTNLKDSEAKVGMDYSQKIERATALRRSMQQESDLVVEDKKPKEAMDQNEMASIIQDESGLTENQAVQSVKKKRKIVLKT